MAKPKLIEIPFPLKGLDLSAPAGRQPEGTTGDCLNVRPQDVYQGRQRGGQRPGVGKYITSRVNGTNAVQGMSQLVRALDPETLEADTLLATESFTYSDGMLGVVAASIANWPIAKYSTTNRTYFTTAADGTHGVGISTNRASTGPPVSGNMCAACIFKQLSLGQAFIIEWSGVCSSSDSPSFPSFLFRINRTDPAGNGFYTMELGWTSSTAGTTNLFKYTTDGAYTSIGGAVAFTLPAGKTWTDAVIWQMHVSQSALKIYADGTLLATYTITSYSGHDGWGIGRASDPSVTTEYYFDGLKVYTAKSATVLRESKLITVAGGSIYWGNINGLTLATNGGVALSSVFHPGIQSAFGNVYFCDGLTLDYKVMAGDTRTVSSWTPTAGALPAGSTSSTVYTVTAATASTKRFSVSPNPLTNQIIFANDWIIVAGCSTAANNRAWKVASLGTNYIQVTEAPTDEASTPATATAKKANLGCRYMTLYRGRIVMYGLQTDVQNWFMSASGDPLDWDYGPATTSATQAIAGNNSDAGKIGDVLNCCAPYSDDLMVMGGDHTLWVMRGDPAAGGTIDNISYQMGIAGPEAYAWSPDGSMYFFGNGQVWRMTTGASGQPESISTGRMDVRFQAIDMAIYWCSMIWDRDRKGLHIFFSPLAQPTTGPVHYYWDRDTDSWWADQMPATHGPACAFVYDGDEPDDRAVLLGGYDGYIRCTDDATLDDDGTPISSYVKIGPMIPGGDLFNARLNYLVSTLSSTSNALRLEVYSAETAEAVMAAATAVFSKSLAAGRNPPMLQRVSGNAFVFKLVNDSALSYTWAVESINAIFSLIGRQRHGRI